MGLWVGINRHPRGKFPSLGGVGDPTLAPPPPHLHGLPAVLLPLLPEGGDGGRGEEDHVGLQVGVVQDLQRGGLQVQDADLKKEREGKEGFWRCSQMTTAGVGGGCNVLQKRSPSQEKMIEPALCMRGVGKEKLPLKPAIKRRHRLLLPRSNSRYGTFELFFETHLPRVDDGPDGVQRGPVELAVELPVLHESAGGHVVLELRAGDEVVVLAVDLALAARAAGVRHGRGEAADVLQQAEPQLVAADAWRTDL